MDIVVAIAANMGNNCLCTGQISCNYLKPVQETFGIIVCTQVRRKIGISNPRSGFVPGIYNNSVDFQILFGVRSRLMERNRLVGVPFILITV